MGAEELNASAGPGTCEEEHIRCSCKETRGCRARIWLVEESWAHLVVRLATMEVQTGIAAWHYMVLGVHCCYPLHMEVAKGSWSQLARQLVSQYSVYIYRCLTLYQGFFL